MEKLIVHSVNIKKVNEKKTFQIVLPENAECITGIAISSDQYLISETGFDKIERQAGTVSLFAADSGESIYSDNLHTVYSLSAMEKHQQFSFDRQLWLIPKPLEFMQTNQSVHCTLIDGFYKDEVGKILASVDYTVRIYLRLKLY